MRGEFDLFPMTNYNNTMSMCLHWTVYAGVPLRGYLMCIIIDHRQIKPRHTKFYQYINMDIGFYYSLLKAAKQQLAEFNCK